MRNLVIAVVALLLAGATQPSSSPRMLSDQELLALCSGAKADQDKCSYYVAGVRAGMAAERSYIGFTFANQEKDSSPDAQLKLLLWLTTQEPFCSESPLTDQQLIDAFIEHMEEVSRRSPERVGNVRGAVAFLLGGQRKYRCSSDAIKYSRP
jgi:hypothetical protein